MKLSHTWKVALLLAAIATSGCVSTFNSPDAAALPPTELRAIQTRSYALQDPKSMLKTVLNVLQDDGFIVDYAHIEMGILHATKTITGTSDLLFNVTGNFFPGAAGLRVNGGTAKIEATANITPVTSGIKVRIGLQPRDYDGWRLSTDTTARPPSTRRPAQSSTGKSTRNFSRSLIVVFSCRNRGCKIGSARFVSMMRSKANPVAG